MPAVRQNRSKLAPTCCQASSTIAAGTTPAGVVDFFMALLSFADSAPRAYRLKAGNAYLTFSTSTGTSPRSDAGEQLLQDMRSQLRRSLLSGASMSALPATNNFSHLLDRRDEGGTSREEIGR